MRGGANRKTIRWKVVSEISGCFTRLIRDHEEVSIDLSGDLPKNVDQQVRVIPLKKTAQVGTNELIGAPYRFSYLIATVVIPIER